jgi:sporulation protein YlmC with PRC-barrel domain
VEDIMNTKVLAVATLTLLATSGAIAQQPASPASGKAEVLSSAPSNSHTVTEYYKQNVYDKSDHKIGQIRDVLMTEDGKVTAFVIGAGGFLGMGRHDVLVPVSAVQTTKKKDKTYLVMDADKDALKAAPGFKYDRTAATWVREDRSTEGSSRPSGDRPRQRKQ